MPPRSATPAPRSRSSRRRPAGASVRAATVVERLAAEYPRAECALTHDSPLQLLVATILSAQCTDERVNLVTPRLFRLHPDAESLATARREELEDLIRPTGFFRSKARAIQKMCQDVLTRHGGRVPEEMEELVRLRGVGRKTANVILGVAFGTPGFAVDTHVIRLTRRLRLTAATDPRGIEEDICGMVPRSQWSDLGLRLILHGRRICVARRPRCADCVLNDFCPAAHLPVAGPARGGRGS